MEDIALIVGGIIPHSYIPKLMAQGAKGVFGPGDPIEGLVNCIKETLPKKKQKVLIYKNQII